MMSERKFCSGCGGRIYAEFKQDGSKYYHITCYEINNYENYEEPNTPVYPIVFKATIMKSKQKDPRLLDGMRNVYMINIPSSLAWKIKHINRKAEHWVKVWINQEEEGEGE